VIFMNKIVLLKTLDKLIGTPLVHLAGLFSWRHRSSVKTENILVIRPGGMGDAVLLLPAIAHLKKHFPLAQIDVLCEKRNAAIFPMSGLTDHIFLYDTARGLSDCLKNKYYMVIDTEQWHRLTALIAFITRAPIRIGFATNERKKLFTHAVPYDHEEYEIYSFLRLAETASGNKHPFDDKSTFLKINPDIAKRFLAEKMNDLSNIVCLFPGATVPERIWGSKNFGETARELCEIGYTVIVLGGKSDKKIAAEIKNYHTGIVDLSGQTSLSETTAIIKMSRMLITSDSGLMHIARAVGTPTIALFGSGIEKKWAPHGASHIVINKHLKCSPCTKFGYTPHCKYGVVCLSSIAPEEIISAAKGLLNKPSSFPTTQI